MTTQDAVSKVGEALTARGINASQEQGRYSWVAGSQDSTVIDAYVPIPYDFKEFSQGRENWQSDLGDIFTRAMAIDFERLLLLQCNWYFILCGEGWSQKDAEFAVTYARPHFKNDTKDVLLLETLRTIPVV